MSTVLRGGRRLILVTLVAFAFGVVMSFIKGSGDGVRLQFGNLSAPWLLVAFLAGSRYRPIGVAAAVGVLATFAALTGFYVEQSPIADVSSASVRFLENPGQMFSFIVTAHGVIYIGGVASGLLFGVLGCVWATRHSRLALSAMALLFLTEPFAWLTGGATIGGEGITSYWWVWLGEIALGVTLLISALRRAARALATSTE